MESRSTFGTMVAVIGSCLIAVGVAWLVAQNWQALPAVAKVLILAAATGGALAGGVLLRARGHGGSARGHGGTSAALLVLASLLFTLSVFLVAQIFSTDASLQGTAWLTALAAAGVLAVAYGLDSRASLVVGLAEVLVWLLLQFLALMEHTRTDGALVALLFLGAGVLSYAAKLLHEERFASLYRVWTVVYFLLFGYVLSFQELLPRLWTADPSWSAGATFVAAVWAAGILLAAVALVRRRGGVARREPAVVAAVVAALLLLVLASRWWAADGFGACTPQHCWSLDEATCAGAPACTWSGEACQDLPVEVPDVCGGHPDQAACAAADCRWGPALGEGCATVEAWCGRTVSDCAAGLQRCARDGYVFAGCQIFADDCWREGLDREACVAVLAGCTVADSCLPPWSARTPSCDQVTDAALCATQAPCEWRDESCRTLDVCAGLATGACAADPRCTWSRLPRGATAPAAALALWIVVNLVFLGLILLVIGYGSWLGDRTVINLGVAFFALDVATRYVGFVIDYWGYASLSVVFILGGIVLLFGGWKLEQWRRRLVARS